MDITNKTGKPLSLTLPGGKKLFLGPGKTGQISNKALERPQIAKLLESGDLESAESSKRKDQGGAQGGASSGSRHSGSGAIRQSGDR